MRDKTVNCTKEAFAKNGRFGFLFRALILSLLMPFCLSYSSTIFHSLSSLGRIGLNLRISLFIFACIDSPACSKHSIDSRFCTSSGILEYEKKEHGLSWLYSSLGTKLAISLTKMCKKKLFLLDPHHHTVHLQVDALEFARHLQEF